MKTRNSHGLLQLGREALAYCQCASALISGNKALFVSVDLIGENNQVILEYIIYINLVLVNNDKITVCGKKFVVSEFFCEIKTTATHVNNILCLLI